MGLMVRGAMFLESHRNLLIGIAIWLGSALVVAFGASLFGANGGEIAAALAGIIGGAVGAAGSALAVFMTLDLQKRDEIEKVNAAILTEVAEQARFAIGHLGACALIQNGTIAAPKAELVRLMGAPRSVIYPAIADQVSRLHRPALVVSFFTRLEEMRYVVDVIAYSQPANEVLTGAHIQQLADLLISVCQIAKFLLEKPKSDADHEANLTDAIRVRTAGMLDEQLASAKGAFPNAESWTIDLQ